MAASLSTGSDRASRWRRYRCDGGSSNCEARGRRAKVFGRDVIIGIAGTAEIYETINRLNARKRKSSAYAENDAVEAVNDILRQAAESGASDIHIEPQRGQLRVRFRQDGVLVNHQDYPLDLAPGLTSRLKVMAKVDIAEKRRHQDGRFFFKIRELKSIFECRRTFRSTAKQSSFACSTSGINSSI